MWLGATTRSPLTASEYSYSYGVSPRTYSYSGKVDSNGTTAGLTDYITTSLFTTTGSTANGSGGWTTSSTNETYSHSGTGSGTIASVTLTTGVSTITITNKPGTVSTALSTIYTYPASTVATSVETTTRTNETAASEYTTLYGSTTTTTTAESTYTQTTTTNGFINDTYRTAATVSITCSGRFETFSTAYWLNDNERAWVFTGGAGTLPLHSLCTEATDSFSTLDSTTTVLRTVPMETAYNVHTVTYSVMAASASTATASWTEVTVTVASATVSTLLTLSHLPNSTSTAYRSGTTTTQRTGTIRGGSFTTTATEVARGAETYSYIGYNDGLITGMNTSREAFIQAFDNSGNVTGFTTRSENAETLTSTEATRGFSFGGSAAISETGTSDLNWTGLVNKYWPYNWDNVSIGGFSDALHAGFRVWQPAVPRGVRVHEPFQQESIYAQIGASGLGFTVPFKAFSIFRRSSVFSPMDTTYTTTDASAGNTRSYTVSVGTSATNDTASFIFATRATVSTTETSASASLYNTVELTRRFRSRSDATWDDYRVTVIVGGKQCDTRLEIAAIDAGVIDYTIVDTTAAHAGILTTVNSYTTSAASSNLTVFRRIQGWASQLRGAGYTITPKWQTVWTDLIA